jgi:hypothetical protein
VTAIIKDPTILPKITEATIQKAAVAKGITKKPVKGEPPARPPNLPCGHP